MLKRIAMTFVSVAAVIGLFSPSANAATLRLITTTGDQQGCQISGEWGVRAGQWTGFFCSFRHSDVGWELWAYVP